MLLNKIENKIKTIDCPSANVDEIFLGSIMYNCKDYLMCNTDNLRCDKFSNNVCCLYEFKSKNQIYSSESKIHYDSQTENGKSDNTDNTHIYSYLDNSNIKYTGLRDIGPVVVTKDRK